MEIHLGSDHRGYELKLGLLSHLSSLGHQVHDHGVHDHSRADYPGYARLVGEAVAAANSEDVFGVVVCGSGVGIAIAANKIKGVRCVPAWCEHIAEYGRRHNHANVLAFSGDLQTLTQAVRCLNAYLAATREGERHAARVVMIAELEDQNK
jgi:ribose 5-phosphate isomerase B